MVECTSTNRSSHASPAPLHFAWRGLPPAHRLLLLLLDLDLDRDELE